MKFNLEALKVELEVGLITQAEYDARVRAEEARKKQAASVETPPPLPSVLEPSAPADPASQATRIPAFMITPHNATLSGRTGGHQTGTSAHP